MDQLFGSKQGEKPRILVAPLDWGLGHATRCIPLIRELQTRNCDIWLAGEGAQEDLLRAEFPAMAFLSLPGYRISYAKTKKGLPWKMMMQLPKMKRAIRYEHDWLAKMIAEHKFDAVISDNRYGLYHAAVPCFMITHQLTIKSPAGKWTERLLQRMNYKFINRFKECWVPDLEGENNLAGELSHPSAMPSIPVKYIGPLSRFTKKEIAIKKNHLLVLLSGPEPQRSLLEEMIIRDIVHYDFTATVVRGLPGSKALVPSTNMIKFYNHLGADELNNAMQEADIVIGRTGYSTVMDIMTLQKRSVLIPTPGQTEQEYLGDYLQEKAFACCIEQKDFKLDMAIAMANGFSYQLPDMKTDGLLKNLFGEKAF